MQRLNRRDMRALLDLLDVLHASSGLAEFEQYVVAGLQRIIRCDVTSYNEIAPKHGRARWTVSGVEQIANADAIFATHMHEHPFIQRMDLMRDGVARKVSDFVPERQWRSSGIYHEFYRPHGINHLMAANIPAGDGFIGLAVMREKRDFSETDRTLLSLVSRHIAHVWRDAVLLDESAGEIAALMQGLEAAGWFPVLLAPRERIGGRTGRRIGAMSEPARALLAEYFDLGKSWTGELPAALAAWVDRAALPGSGADDVPAPQQDFPRPNFPRPNFPGPDFIVPRRDRRLVVRLPRVHGPRLLMIREERTAPRVEDFRALGLTPREAEVLLWVAAGKTDAETATILAISRRTVNHLLERVYRKLGVETRLGAVMAAMRATMPEQWRRP